MEKSFVQELNGELHKFISGTKGISSSSSSEITKSAIFLLENLPSAREAVLSYLKSIFDESVEFYFKALENKEGGSSDDVADLCPNAQQLEDVTSILSGFINNNSDAWAPIISTWSLELLGILSSKYSETRVLTIVSGLNDNIQLWMNCLPIQLLANLSTQCLATMIGSDPDACITALLNTSIQHSPHFDWVVAHIGSCFPTTVITRVLSCGLKDYCLSCNEAIRQKHQIVIGAKSPKLASVVGILGHLVSQHGEDIRQALVILFQNSIQDSQVASELYPYLTQQQATLPFLLQMAKFSPALLSLISPNLVSLLTDETVNIICTQILRWPIELQNQLKTMRDLVVYILLNCNEGVVDIIIFLLKTAAAGSSMDTKIHPDVEMACSSILDHLINQLHGKLFSSQTTDIPILYALQASYELVCKLFLTTNERGAQSITTLLSFAAIYCGEHGSAGIFTYLITQATLPWHIQYVRILFQEVQGHTPGAAAMTLQNLFANLHVQSDDTNRRIISNLFQLLKWELQYSNSAMHCTFGPYLQDHILVLSSYLAHSQLCMSNVVARLLSIMAFKDIPADMTMLLGNLVVIYFFNVLQDPNPVLKTHHAEICHKLVIKLTNESQNSSTQELIMRNLLQGALSSTNCNIFGGKLQSKDLLLPKHKLLLQENLKHSTTLPLPRSYSSAFHSGVISRIARRTNNPVPGRKDVMLNTQLFINLLQTTCNSVNGKQAVQIPPGFRMLALLMVEFVSSDVIYNGLPWPDEDFIKITMERDLHIKRMFDDYPILWSILWLVAYNRPCLCYCSVLIRALMATVQSHWSSTQEKLARNCPKELNLTCNILDIMAVGQFLPCPLSRLSEVFPKLKSHEVHLLLADVWTYMKENVPSPASFTISEGDGSKWRDFNLPCSIKYTQRLHFILLNNIENFGPSFCEYFDEIPVIG